MCRVLRGTQPGTTEGPGRDPGPVEELDLGRDLGRSSLRTQTRERHCRGKQAGSLEATSPMDGALPGLRPLRKRVRRRPRGLSKTPVQEAGEDPMEAKGAVGDPRTWNNHLRVPTREQVRGCSPEPPFGQPCGAPEGCIRRLWQPLHPRSPGQSLFSKKTKIHQVTPTLKFTM